MLQFVVERSAPLPVGSAGLGINRFFRGMLKKAASGVLALLPCSRTMSTLRASKGLRPCWTDFFEHSQAVRGGCDISSDHGFSGLCLYRQAFAPAPYNMPKPCATILKRSWRDFVNPPIPFQWPSIGHLSIQIFVEIPKRSRK